MREIELEPEDITPAFKALCERLGYTPVARGHKSHDELLAEPSRAGPFDWIAWDASTVGDDDTRPPGVGPNTLIEARYRSYEGEVIEARFLTFAEVGHGTIVAYRLVPDKDGWVIWEPCGQRPRGLAVDDRLDLMFKETTGSTIPDMRNMRPSLINWDKNTSFNRWRLAKK